MHLACEEHEKLITDLRAQLEQEKKKHEETKSQLRYFENPANLQKEILDKLDSLKLQISEEKDKCMGREGKRKLLEEIKECREEIEDLKEQKFKDAREISTLQNSNEELNGVIESLRGEIRGLENSWSSWTEIEELQNQKEALEKELEDQKLKIEELTTQGVEDSEKIEVLEKEKVEYLTYFKTIETGFKSRSADRDQRIQDQQLIIEENQRIIKSLEQELNELNAEMKQKEKRAKNFANQQEKSNQEVREFQKTRKLQEIERLKQKVAILEKEVEQETAKHVQTGDNANDTNDVLALLLEELTMAKKKIQSLQN